MVEVTMRWQRQQFCFRDQKFEALGMVEHFDVAEVESSSSGEDEEALQARLRRRAVEEQLQRCETELGACLWIDTNRATLRVLEDWRGSYEGMRVLELGAGAGACGIALAYDGADSTVTDVEALLPLLQRSVELNPLSMEDTVASAAKSKKKSKEDKSSRRKGRGAEPRRAAGRCQAAAVEWEKEAQMPTLPGNFDLVVVCDCLYENRDSWSSLQQLLQRLVGLHGHVLLASAMLRQPFLEAFTEQMAEVGFTLLKKEQGGPLGDVCVVILRPQAIQESADVAPEVALMFLLIWIRSEVQKEDVPAHDYVDDPANNPTWFSAEPLDVSSIPGLPPAVKKQLEQLCKSKDSALCPEIFASSWGLRKEHYTGSALDGLLPLHMAQRNLRLGIVGTAGKGLDDFISSLPGYSKLTRYFSSEESYDDYLADHDYGFSTQNPALFGAIVVQSAATCPSGGTCSGDWDIVIHLNTTGPSTSTADIKGATDINTKLTPEVSTLNKGLKMSTSRIYWSGGMSRSLGLALPTGGLVDLQSLVYAWIFNSTGAYQLPSPSELPSCDCIDPQGQATEDFSQCNSSSLFTTALRALTPHWSTTLLGNSAGCLGRLSGILPVSVREIPFPTPAYTDDPFASFVESVFGLFFVLVFIWPSTRIMKSLVEDKEARINEVMKMMGMPAEAILLGWYLTYGLLWIIPAALMTVVCWDSVFQHSNKLLVFIFFWLFGVCVVTLCSFIAVFFSKAKTASVVGALLFFLLYFPFLFVSDSGASASTKALSSLSPPVALSIGAGLIAQFESAGV
ncbi:unnamed protein product, partial [Cladocopium goreaui]